MNALRLGILALAAAAAAGCIASERQRATGAGDADTGAVADTGELGDTAVVDATSAGDATAPDDTADARDAVDATDARDAVDAADATGPVDGGDATTVFECDEVVDCDGALAACEAWACTNHRCERVAYTTPAGYADQWFFTSMTVTDGGVRAVRGRLNLGAAGSWTFENEGFLASSDATPPNPMSGTWCASPTGAVELHAAGAGDVRELTGQLADGDRVIALGARDEAQLALMVRTGKSLPTAWAEDAHRYRFIGLRATLTGALQSVAGWVILTDEGSGSCSGTLDTSDGQTLTVSSRGACLSVQNDGRVSLQAEVGTDDRAQVAATSTWFGYFAAAGDLLVLNQTSDTNEDATPLPSLVLLVRETGATQLGFNGRYATYRLGRRVNGDVEGVWGTVDYTLTGDIEGFSERDTLGGQVGASSVGCSVFGVGDDCPGFYTVTGRNANDDAGVVLETILGPSGRKRAGQALSPPIIGRAAPLWVSIAHDANSGDAPARPSLGVHVRRLETPGL